MSCLWNPVFATKCEDTSEAIRQFNGIVFDARAIPCLLEPVFAIMVGDPQAQAISPLVFPSFVHLLLLKFALMQ